MWVPHYFQEFLGAKYLLYGVLWLTNSSGRTARPRISVGFQDGRHRKRPGEQQNIKQGEQDFFHGETPLCRWSGSTVVMWIELGYSES